MMILLAASAFNYSMLEATSIDLDVTGQLLLDSVLLRQYQGCARSSIKYGERFNESLRRRDKVAGIGEAVRDPGVNAQQVVYVGDHSDDCRAAPAAQVGFYAVEKGVYGKGDFPNGTTMLVTLAELPKYIRDRQ
jgi:hypothetical protein